MPDHTPAHAPDHAPAHAPDLSPAKPVDPAMLYATLLKWLERQASVTPDDHLTTDVKPAEDNLTRVASPADASDQNMLARLARIRGLDIEKGLQAVRNRDIRRYLGLLEKAINLDLGDIRQAAILSQHENIRRRAHSLKGVAGTIGWMDVHQLAEALENHLRRQTPSDEEVIVLVEALEQEFQQIVTDLRLCLNIENHAKETHDEQQ